MFPSGWGLYDLFGRNGLPVDGGPAKKVGKQHDWNDMEILAPGQPHPAGGQRRGGVDWRDPQPRPSTKARSACNCTPTRCRRRFTSRAWC